MTYPGSHLLVSWIFGIAGQKEVAVTSLRCTNVDDPFGFIALDAQAAVNSAFLTTLATAMGTCLKGSGFTWGSWSQLKGMKIASIGPQGNYLGDPAVGDVAPVITGLSSTGFPQNTVVLTLDSGTSFGHATKGRMYLPHCMSATIGTAPLMGGVSNMLNTSKTFMTAVRTAMLTLPGAPQPAIISKFGSGTARRILKLSMDDILDVQRRRKEQLVGTRIFVNFP